MELWRILLIRKRLGIKKARAGTASCDGSEDGCGEVLAIGRRVAIEFGCGGEVSTHWDLVNKGADDLEVTQIGDRVSGEAVLPKGELRIEAISEAVFDEFDGLVERHTLRRDQQMNMVRHDHIGVQLVVTNGAVMQQRVNE